ncbi:hypothetical protein F5X68DRAFT_205620 [Plectosphaerella plurivora]|uniref:SWIM-type domain-containing protein n=1 Tax=Plectosphaerella plurivora TaxID=936078 RepID=A0A9P8VET0_9PEZI|nr:hypothetical protein F5X68DRAFT_205620 [Plectosphaerella plurivora]
MTAPLPSPRHFLTSLIDSIADIQTVPVDDDAQFNPPNPLRHLPPSARPLLTTLHVLFPALLLPALDLLDRSLVVSVLPEEQDEGAKPSFYLVRSAASSSRKTFNAFSAIAPYVVRLESWNCSCANFAFEAFPAAGRGGSIIPATDVDGLCDDDTQGLELEFGGLSFDGREAGGVPCCKHLLACLLAERWGAVLGDHVVTRRAGREEMVGLLADT